MALRVMEPTEVVKHRFTTQRLLSASLRRPLEAQRLIIAVDATSLTAALYGLALRNGTGDLASLRYLFEQGMLRRTRVLRPRPQLLAAEDLRWLVNVAGRAVQARLSGKLEDLGLDARTIGNSMYALADLLADTTALTRPQIAQGFAAKGLPSEGEPFAHLVVVAELRGLICSGPPSERHHTYVLVDDVLPYQRRLDPEEALCTLALRFFGGSGPASLGDFVRWSSLPTSEARRGIDLAGPHLAKVDVDGLDHWYDPSLVRASAPDERGNRALLVPKDDPVVANYPDLPLPRAAGHPDENPDTPPRAGAGEGFVVVDGRSVGLWHSEPVGERGVDVSLRLAPDLDASVHERVDDATRHLTSFIGRELVTA